MEDYKKEFIEFMLDCQVLRFGDFVTKSGRNTPFFINTGFYRTGTMLQQLGSFYARAIYDNFGGDFDVLFGPAYKGIPLAVATAIALSEEYGLDVRYSANRKEVKDHGEGGIFLGSPIERGDRIVIVEDVTTAGTSIRETMPLLTRTENVSVKGLIVSVDRMERGMTALPALEEIGQDYHMKTGAIVTMGEVVEYLYRHAYKGKVYIDDAMKETIDDYYREYGAK